MSDLEHIAIEYDIMPGQMDIFDFIEEEEDE